MRRPLLRGSLFFLTGILVAHFIGMWTALWLGLAGASFFVVLFLFLHPTTFAQKEKILSLFLVLSIIWLGAFWYSLSRYPENFAPAYSGLTVNGVGVVASYPKTNEFGMSCYVKMKELKAEKQNIAHMQRILLKAVNPPEQTIYPGDTLKFSGVITLPSIARNPGQFNYREYLANQEVFLIVNTDNEKMTIAEKGKGIAAIAAKSRMKVVHHLNRILPQRERGLILGMLFGDTGLMTDEEYTAYKRTGVVHLFSVSGLHVSMVLGLIWFLLSFLKLKPVLRLMLGAVVLTGYGFMVGWGAPILRASIMAVLGLLALTVSRKNDLYNSLGAAVLIILLLSPGELFQAGFQLSFITTAGIVYLTPWLEKKGCGKWLAVPLAAFLASSPILAFHFNQISLISPFVNIFAVAVSTVATAFSFLAAIITWILPALATPLFWAAGSIMYLLSELLLWCAHFQWAGINIATPSLPALVLVYLFLAILPVLPYSRYLLREILREIPVKFKAVFISFLVFVVLFTWWPVSGKLQFIFLDVGQGDSFLLLTPRGKTVLIDGGGTPGSSYSIGKNIVSPVLCHYGINKIDLILMSHNHLDHSEGLLEIISLFPVGTFFRPPREANNPLDQSIEKLCGQKRIVLKELTAGQKIYLEPGVYLEVLHPAAEDEDTGNNRSLVVRLNYQESSWLLTGDIEKEAIEKLLARGVDLQADILKIPHHGSITSYHPEFYEKVNPQAVVISVGKNNFNQPHAEIEKYFVQKGIPVYISREKGAVFTESNGQKIMIKTFL